MQKVTYTKFINAPRQKVWETMINPETYAVWTKTFNQAGSTYEGKWETGSDIKFLGQETDGTVSGMLGKVKEARPYEFSSIQYSGEIIHGKETVYGPDELYFENYTFNEKDGGTELVVELNLKDEYVKIMDEFWPNALDALKELAEK
jgi:uncharacterized protein YndB with AHSA1/START domain